MRTFLCLVCSICLALVLGGCDTQPLKEKLIIEGVAVDVADGEYSVTVQVYSPSADNTAQSDYQLLYSKGKTVYEALRLIDENTGKQSYYSDTKVIVFSYKSFQNGAWDNLEYFIRSGEMSTNVCLAVTMEQAHQLFLIEKEGLNMPAKVLSNLLHYGKSDATPFSGEMMTVSARLFGKDGDVSLPILRLEEIDQKKYPRLNGVMCFKGQQPHFAMTERQKWVYNWVQEYVDDRAFVFNFEGHPFTVHVKNAKTDIKTSLQNNDVAFHLQLELACDIMETNLPQGVVLSKLESFENTLAKEVEQLTLDTIKQVFQQKECDVFNFARTVRKQHPDYYKQLNDWREMIPQSTVTCQAEVAITRAGQGTID